MGNVGASVFCFFLSVADFIFFFYLLIFIGAGASVFISFGLI